MEPVNSACNTVLTCWGLTAGYRKYIRSLGDNLAGLERKMDELGGVYEDVKRIVDEAEGQGWKRKDDADQWLRAVKDLEKEVVDGVLANGKRLMGKKCLCGICFVNCRARYNQSKLAEVKIAELVTELDRGRKFSVKENVAYEPADLILKRSLGALREKRDELGAVFETVKLRVKQEEERQLVRTPDVGSWLKRVEDLLEKELLEVLEAGKDSQSQRFHGISKLADEKRAMLEEKILQGRGFAVFTYKPDDPLIEEIPLEHLVGAQSMFEEVWNWVEDDTVKSIGLFGMGGVGKTTLLDRVHNQFLKINHDYNFVLRVVVSRPIDLNKIQNAILERLKLEQKDGKDFEIESRTARICRLMKEKNFLLFLDDLWDPINLVKDVGVPCGDNPRKYKIIFTTRDETVCNGMKADKIKKVDCLPPDEALQLFRQNLGEKTWGAHPQIPRIAARMVHECKYLPLALITVAGAMAGTTQLKRWLEAEDDLTSRLSEFQDMEKGVLVRLEFSYNRLPDETHKMCFLYLSIFPEDHEICKDEAINLWIGEGFLDEYREGFLDKYGDTHEARSKGEKIFRRIKDMCLLESVRYEPLFGEMVKMHDVVREMALWVYSERGRKKNTVLVYDRLEVSKRTVLKKLQDAERIFFLGAPLIYPLGTVSYPNLSTLIVRDRRASETILNGLMPQLRVLDTVALSNNIWDFKNLRYLRLHENSKGTAIKVPIEIKNRNKLEVLILSLDCWLPVRVLSELSSLKVFCWLEKDIHRIYSCGEHQRLDYIDYEIKLLETLQNMQSMEEISIRLISLEGVEKLLGSHRLHSLLRELHLFKCGGLSSLRISTSLLRRLKNLHSISLVGCKIGRIEIICKNENTEGSSGRHSHGEPHARKPARFSSLCHFHSLSEVFISRCVELVDVTSLIYHAPVVEALHIEFCGSLEEVIVGDVEDDQVTDGRLFPCLRYLNLASLERLGSICRRALPFPSLEEIKVVGCPILKKLPLDRDSGKNSLRVIEGQKKWLERLQWDDPISEPVFCKKFQFSDKT